MRELRNAARADFERTGDASDFRIYEDLRVRHAEAAGVLTDLNRVLNNQEIMP